MDKNDIVAVPMIVVERLLEEHRRDKRNLAIALTASVIAGFVAVATVHLSWVHLWKSYDYETTTETHILQQDGEGVNIIGDNNATGEPARTDDHSDNSN